MWEVMVHYNFIFKAHNQGISFNCFKIIQFVISVLINESKFKQVFEKDFLLIKKKIRSVKAQCVTFTFSIGIKQVRKTH